MNSTPHTPITSKENGVIKQIRALSDPKHRKAKKLFLIEGVKMVEEALGTGVPVRTVVAAPSLLRHHGKGIVKAAEARGVGMVWVSDRLLDSLSENRSPQPVLAVVPMQDHTERDLLMRPSGLVVVAHQLQDPGNLGTIIRTVEATGAAGVAITPNTADPYGTKAVQASMGSILRVPVVRTGDIAAHLDLCRQAGMQTMALTLQGEKDLFELDLKEPTAVIVGQEGSGLPEDVQRLADLRVRIPMSENIDSLNAAVSIAVFLYEALRQRRQTA